MNTIQQKQCLQNKVHFQAIRPCEKDINQVYALFDAVKSNRITLSTNTSGQIIIIDNESGRHIATTAII